MRQKVYRLEASVDELQKPRNLVVGQHVTEAKRVLAEQMRRDMTPSEAHLWERLRGNKLGVNFRRQQIIDGFIADFYCHSAALVIEVDGPIHDPEYDAERDRILSAHGLTILRFTNEQVSRQIGVVLYQVRQHVKTRKSPPSLPPDPP